MKETAATAAPEQLIETKNTASLKDFFLSLRPEQWSKNLLVFAAMIFANRLGDPKSVLLTIGAFFDFCILSGAVYLINDVIDFESDRYHPIKRNRPIASGRLNRNFAMVAGVFLYAAALVFAYILNPAFFRIAFLYTIVTVGYTYYFKKVAILDVFAISIGFVLRAIAGSAGDEPGTLCDARAFVGAFWRASAKR